MDANGAGLKDQKVCLSYRSNPYGSIIRYGDAMVPTFLVTGPDGRWSATGTGNHMEYRAGFSNQFYGPAQATVLVQFPKQCTTLTLYSSMSQVTRGAAYQLGGELRNELGDPITDVWVDIGGRRTGLGWTFTAWQMDGDGRFAMNRTAGASSMEHQATFEGTPEYYGTESNIVIVTVE